jgi:GNAT superfamily N-acetyltransferase
VLATQTVGEDGGVQLRRATMADLPAMVETITAAFDADPTWSYAFPDPVDRPAQYRRWWHLYLVGALRYDDTWLADDGAAVAVWIPPGGTELAAPEQAQVPDLVRELVGDWAEEVFALLDQFDEAQPTAPHYYLTLLGTRPDRRGEGLGMALVRHCLERIDGEHRPAYLESTNPANNARYEKVGFAPIGSFTARDGGPTVTTMWRPAR